MSLTIVLSGAKSSEPQLRTALSCAGFDVQKTVADHGLPGPHIEKRRDAKSKQPVGFVTVLAGEDELDTVVERAGTLSWRLRLHFETPPAPGQSEETQIAATLADMQRQIDELKAKGDHR